jgi:hypothetical protein
MTEDDHTSERCPICKDEECKDHLLARFDARQGMRMPSELG